MQMEQHSKKQVVLHKTKAYIFKPWVNIKMCKIFAVYEVRNV